MTLYLDPTFQQIDMLIHNTTGYDSEKIKLIVEYCLIVISRYCRPRYDLLIIVNEAEGVFWKGEANSPWYVAVKIEDHNAQLFLRIGLSTFSPLIRTWVVTNSIFRALWEHFVLATYGNNCPSIYKKPDGFEQLFKMVGDNLLNFKPRV